MTSDNVLQRIKWAAVSCALACASLTYGQPLTQVTTNGKEFHVVGRSATAAVDVPQGRLFRVAAKESLTLQGIVHLPASDVADHKLVKLVVRFHTGSIGATLYSVAFGGLKQERNLFGDFTAREEGNVFTFNSVNVDLVPLRLNIGFTGGFEGGGTGQEFLLTRIDAFYPTKLHPTTAKLPSAPAPSTTSSTPASPAQPVALGSANVGGERDLLWGGSKTVTNC